MTRSACRAREIAPAPGRRADLSVHRDWSRGDNSFKVDRFGLGFRLPAIIIGPFAKQAVVQHERREHSSIAKFCGRIFNLPGVTMRDADPDTDDLMSALDFDQSPRPYSDFVPAGM